MWLDSGQSKSRFLFFDRFILLRVRPHFFCNLWLTTSFILNCRFQNDEIVLIFCWERLVNFFCLLWLLDLFFFLFNFLVFFFLNLWVARAIFTRRLNFFGSPPWPPWSLSLDPALNFLTFLPAAFSRVWIRKIKITVKLIPTRTASLIIGLIFFFSLLAEVSPKESTVSVPEIIPIDFSLHEVLHVGAPFFPKLHCLDGSHNWRTLLRLLVLILLVG